MTTLSVCDGWEFTPAWTSEFAEGGGTFPVVRVPHTTRELPLHYADETQYEMLCGYRRTVTVPDDWADRQVFLRFDGAAHEATVYANGVELARHRNGYTAFTVDLTPFLADGEIAIAVRLDSRENLNQPPFGYVVDFMTFGGLYREVWIDIVEPTHIDDMFVRTPDLRTVRADVQLTAPDGADAVALTVRTSEGAVVASRLVEGPIGAPLLRDLALAVPRAKPWSPESPTLYTFEVELRRGAHVLDRWATRFGFRTAQFRADGFYLNGARYKIRGLNRHQSYPYLGYAAPASLQRDDARILKDELQVNAVRTSHYPQSQHFLDACDELGLLVFTEIPGWQHIGDDDWKQVALVAVEQMIRQNRNHPSIILWGVRINESGDDHDFYVKTNRLARSLDPTRQTSGVRFIWRSELLEDVFTFNDFSHVGSNRPLLPRRIINPDPRKPYLIGEFNGAMFPIKAFDPPRERLDHALRYANVLNKVERDRYVTGSFGWCMTDYYTHGDFGSGDRIGYYGVMDMFRNPKLAASVYAAQGEGAPVLEVASSMAIGDYPDSRIGDNYIFTNADSVRFYKNGELIKEFTPGRSRWRALAHPPILLDDTIGSALADAEGFGSAKAEAMKRSIMDVQRYGQSIPPSRILLALWRLVRWGVSPRRAIKMYLAHVESWGATALTYRFEAVRDGQVVSVVEKSSRPGLRLIATASHTTLLEGDTYDVAAVRVRIVDSHGNTAPYATVPVTFSVEGPSELVGPASVSAEGGMCGTYVRTTGSPGAVRLTIASEGIEPVVVDFEAVLADARVVA